VYLVMIELDGPCRHVTRGVFQERPAGGMDSLIAKVSADGRRVAWCTYLGGSGRGLAPSIRVGGDATAVILTADLQRALLSTYMGGRGEDLFRACAVTARGELVLVGSTTSTDWPTTSAIQPAPAGGPDEIIVAKLRPVGPDSPGAKRKP
jgi:hypothetical protein